MGVRRSVLILLLIISGFACAGKIVATSYKWVFLDNGQVNTSTIASAPQAVSVNGKIYSIWHEQNSGLKINVAVFNADATTPENYWVVLGTSNGLNFNPAADATFGQLVAFDSKLYATWVENDSGYKIHAAVYNGNDSAPSWTFVDVNGAGGMNDDPSKTAMYPRFMVFNSKLYLAWSEDERIRVAVYNGDDASPSWNFVDTQLNMGPSFQSEAIYPSFAILNSKLYLTWIERSTTGGRLVRLVVYGGDDTTPSWTFVDGNSTGGLNRDASQLAQAPQIVTFNEKLYLAWPETTGATLSGYATSQIRMKVYNGNDAAPDWASLEDSGLSVNASADSEYVSLAVSNGKLYVAWEEAQPGSYPFWVKVYNGDDSAPQWSFADNSEESTNCENFGQGSGMRLLSVENQLYAISASQCPSNESIRFQWLQPQP